MSEFIKTLPWFLLVVPALQAAVCRLDGSIATAQGEPITGVTIQARKGRSHHPVQETTSSPEGMFSFDNLPCDKYTIIPRVFSRSMSQLPLVTVDARKQSQLTLIVPEDSIAAGRIIAEQTCPPVPTPSFQPITIEWRWDLESQIRREGMLESAGQKELEHYDKLDSNQQVQLFLTNYQEHLMELAGIHHNNRKEAMAQMAALSLLLRLPRPIFSEYAFNGLLSAMTRQIMASPDEETLAHSRLSDALALIKTTAPPGESASVERAFRDADPPEKTAMLLKAIRIAAGKRIWPSAFLLFIAYLPGDSAFKAFSGWLDSDAVQSSSVMSTKQRAELALKGVQAMTEGLEKLLSDDTGPELMPAISCKLKLQQKGLTGPASIRRVFGGAAAAAAKDDATRERWQRAAAAFHQAWLIALVIYS